MALILYIHLVVGDCGELKPIPNGHIEYSDGSHLVGSFGNYGCNTGYYLHGNCQRYCQQGNSDRGQFYFHWTGSQPQCVGMYHSVRCQSALIYQSSR